MLIKNMKSKQTYIRFELGGEQFRWLVPDNMTLAQGLTRVVTTSIPKIARLIETNEKQINEMDEAISSIDSNDPDAYLAQCQAKDARDKLSRQAELNIISIEVVQGSKTTYL